MIAVSFAAGLNVYATILTLGIMARLHWVVLPTGLDVLTSWWVIGASSLLFAAEFVADKVPGFDLVWNAAHSFVRVPAALLLAYGATTHLSPELQMLVTVLGGAIAAITHGSKLAVRGAVTASPEPFSNIALSTSEDVAAVAVTSVAAHHPLIAGGASAVAIVIALLLARTAIRAIRKAWGRLSERFGASPQTLRGVILIAGLLISTLHGSRASLHAQTLARPGWAGSGLNVQPWWQHAVIYEIDVRSFQDSNGDGDGDLKGIGQRLEYLKALGVDAILLDSVAEAKAASAAPIDAAVGTVDDFDDLSREASRHNIRILLGLQQAGTSADSRLLAVARFWLSRGVAGFRVAGAGDAVSSLHRLVSSYTGQRVLITDASAAAGTQQASVGLGLDTALLSVKAPPAASGANLAGQIRVAMEQSQTVSKATPLVASDGAGVARSLDRFGGKDHDADMAKIIGTILLLNRSVPVVYLGQELGLHSASGEAVAMPWGAPPAAPKPETPPPVAAPAPPVVTPSAAAASERYVPYVRPVPAAKAASPTCEGCTDGRPVLAGDPKTVAGQDPDTKSVLNFYRQLSQLHHGNAALRDGEQIMLNHDDLNALVWVRRTASVTPLSPAVVIVCNLSDRPLVLPLKAELARLHLRGSFLRTILRSDDAMGSMHLEPVTVPPFGVYVGELRY